jgi:putative ABC transport system permease protein
MLYENGTFLARGFAKTVNCMVLNYLKIALRNLRKRKVFSAINIFGLAVGLACCLLIAAYLYEELSYDRYPDKSGQIYRVGIKLNQNGGTADYPDVDVAVGAGMKNTYPEILESTRLLPLGEQYVKNGDRIFKETRLAMCDTNFLQVFSIPLAEGDVRTALRDPHSIVVTRSFAKKYFGDSAALGKIFPGWGGGIGLKVTGVIDDFPANSHFHYDAFLSMGLNRGGMTGTTWSNVGFYTYLVLDKHADPKALAAKFPDLVQKYIVPETVHDMGVSLAEAQKSAKDWVFYLMPVTDIHLYSHSKYELEANGDIQYIYIFGALAVFILLLACVNFTNLATASSAQRAREVGVRKVLGSVRKQLIGQFLVESVVLTFFALLLGLVLVYLLLPFFNQVSDKHISMALFTNARVILAMITLILVVGILAGIYPSFFLSSFQTTTVLKGAAAQSTGRRSLLRSGLVVFQFMISTSFMVSTVFVYQQLHYMQNKKLGYDPSQVLAIEDTYRLRKDQKVFREELQKDPRVISVTVSRDAPVNRMGNGVDGSEVFAKELKGPTNGGEIHAFFFHVDYDYLSTLGMKMAAGRYFSRDFGTDSTAVVINETAVRDLGWTNNDAALNKVIVSSGLHEYRVVGVVKDFNYASVKQKIAPLMIMLGNNGGTVLVKIKTADIRGFIADTKQKWMGYTTETPFSYYFLDDHFAALYAGERKTGELFTTFAVVAVIIACLGLFGLVAYATQQRTKEIGVRKVLGASLNQLLFLLSKEFLWLVGIAFLVSVPLTYWAMQAWLTNFAYRIEMAWWVFLLAGAAAILIAAATLSFQTIRAALANPVKSLRTE